MSNEVLTEVLDGGVFVITINRPEARNAVNMAVTLAVAAAIDELERRDDLRVGVLTGAGGTFCAGADLKALAATGVRPRIEGRGLAGLTEAPPKKPLIAAVEGYALGGGFEIALACDLVVAAETAQFGLPETKRGLIASAGGVMRLPRQMPWRVAAELVLTGDMLTPARAYAFGLINQVTPQGGALEGALQFARKICANGPLAVMASKRIMSESADWLSTEMFARQAPIVDAVFKSEDAHEGATAFAEKRAPAWKGR